MKHDQYGEPRTCTRQERDAASAYLARCGAHDIIAVLALDDDQEEPA